MRDDRKASERAAPSLMGDALLLVFKIAFCCIFLFVVFTMIFGLDIAEDESMKPAVREGDIVLYYRLNKDYRARDLVIVKEGDKTYTRRIIATAGDEVGMNEDGVLINGYRQIEDESYTDTEAMVDGVKYPITIPEGQIFVMGDDRPTSVDSRTYGPVDVKSATEGRVLYVLKRRHL